MPFLYLSPSTQEFNPYVTAGNEEYWMNRVADAMEPYLLAAGIAVTRNDPERNAAAAIRQSNSGMYDFHLALHSNAAPAGQQGTYRGIDVYYFPRGADSQRMANILVDNLRPVYPLPDQVRALPTVTIGEVARTRAPAVLAELGYHDNRADARWVEESVEPLARALSLGVTEYFGVPFQEPQPILNGQVSVQWGRLNIRDFPSMAGKVLTRAEDGQKLLIYGEANGWYSVGIGDLVGYARSLYVTLEIQPR